MLIVRNALETLLVIDDLVFQPAGQTGAEKLVAGRTAGIAAALVNGQLEVVDEEPEPGDAVILDEVVGTGVEQQVPHGLLGAPSQVAVAVSHVPGIDYGGETAKAFSVSFGEHTATHVLVTATTGVRFNLIVTP